MEACPQSPLVWSAEGTLTFLPARIISKSHSTTLNSRTFQDCANAGIASNFHLGSVWGRCWLGTRKHFPETEFWKVVWILRRGLSEVHGFRLGTLYISLRAERAVFDGHQSKWLAEPFHRFSHYLASMLKVCFFIRQYVLSKHLYNQCKVSKREQRRTKIWTPNQARHSRI